MDLTSCARSRPTRRFMWDSAEHLNHLTDLALLRKDTAAVRRFITSSQASGFGFGYAHALFAADLLGDEETLDSLRSVLDSVSPGRQQMVLSESGDVRVGYEDAERVWDLLADERDLSRHALNRGRPKYAAGRPPPFGALSSYSLQSPNSIRIVDALYGDGDSLAAVEAVALVARSVEQAPPPGPCTVNGDEPLCVYHGDACAMAQWRLARSDTTGVRRMAATLHEMSQSETNSA